MVNIERTFDLLDGNSTSIVGPTISLVPQCGCRPPKKDYGVNNTPKIPTVHPAAHALMKDKKPVVCKRGACLNGGRCIPTLDGYKLVESFAFFHIYFICHNSELIF